MADGVHVKIRDGLLKVEIPGRDVQYESIEQENAPEPETIISLSPKRIVLSGMARNLQGDVKRGDDGSVEFAFSVLPELYAEGPCSFWGQLINECGIIGEAQYSPALDAVLITGWQENGRVATLQVKAEGPPEPLRLPSGEDLIYFGDTKAGYAYFQKVKASPSSPREEYVKRRGAPFLPCTTDFSRRN